MNKKVRSNSHRNTEKKKNFNNNLSISIREFIHPSILPCMNCSISEFYSTGFDVLSEYFGI